MEVKPTYKQTELRSLPEGWKIAQLSDLVASGPKNGYSGRSGKGARGTPTLTLTATTSGRMILNNDTVKFLEETLEPKSDIMLQNGDVLVQRSNTPELVGTTAIFDGPNGVYAYPDLMMRLRFKAPEAAKWFWRYANSSEGRRYFVSVAAGSTGTMPKLSGDKLRSMHLPLPPINEQRAIAQALGDVDALIAALERLIAKKRDIKQATMQQLLTGKTRLPGFSGKWEVKKLGDVGAFHKGSGVKKDEARSGDLPCVRYGEIYTHHNDYVRVFNSWISRQVAETATLLRQGDIMFAGSGETKEEIGKCVAFVDNVEAYAGGDIVILRPTCVDSLFLSYLLNTPEVSSQKASRGQGDAVVHISSSALASVSLSLPQLAEQTAIAAVLSDLDAELTAIEARRDKTRAIKQGMMQELLTGKTRLI